MDLTFNWINLLILFGAIQGLIFAIILLFNRKHPGARFLAFFMLVLSYNGFETFNWSSDLDRYVGFFNLFTFITIFAAGPSFYLYIRSLLYPETKLPAKTVIAHYGFFFFQLIVRLGIIIYHLLWLAQVVESDISGITLDNWYSWYSEPLSIVVYLGYLAAAIRVFMKAGDGQQLRSLTKEGQSLVRKWLKALLFCGILLGIAWPLTYLAPYFMTIPFSKYYPVELALVLFIYWIAMAGYHRTKQIYLKPVQAVTGDLPETYLETLIHAMEHEKLYLDPELNVKKLAEHTGVSARTISAILNQRHQTNFNDFINQYRVNEVCKKLLDPGQQHLTISALALDAGFNSQATFQRAFKNSTGMTPRSFVTKHAGRAGKI